MTLESLPKTLSVLLLEKHAEDSRFIQNLLSDGSLRKPSIKFKTASNIDEALRLSAVENYHVMLLSTGSLEASDLALPLAKITAHSPACALVLLCDIGEEEKLDVGALSFIQDWVLKSRMESVFLHKILSSAVLLKRAQRKHRESSQLLLSVMSAASEGLLLINAGREIVRANSAACAFLGWNEGDLQGRLYSDVLLTGHPNEKMSVSGLSFISKSLEDGVRRSVEHVCFFDSQSKPLWVHCVAYPVTEGNKAAGVWVAFKSLSEALQKEDKLKDAIQEQLRNEQRLVEALSELKKLNQQLSETQDQLIQAEKLQSVGRLAAGVAHEVKNPLAILMQGAEYLQQVLSKEDKDTFQVLEDMLDAVRRADAVIKGLLDFSAPAEAEMKEDDLVEVMEDSLQLVRHLLVQGQIQIVKNYAPGLKPFVFDRSRMQQVFVNILSNAIQAMKEGGALTLSITPEAKQSSSRHVIVQVSDTGTGIPAEILSKVFDPFVTTRRGKGGTGLGLSVVRGIMALHQGEIRVENNAQGVGATVTLRF